jgi:hypothetical protein
MRGTAEERTAELSRARLWRTSLLIASGIALLVAALVFRSPHASAQLTPAPAAADAGGGPGDAGGPAAAKAASPSTPPPSTSAGQDRTRGPAEPSLRERGGRSRRANPASGVFFVLVLVGALGYWVLKRIRR